MKKLLFILVGLLCTAVVFAQVNFQELTLEEACKKAKTENKPVFLDCYTSWCGPCKMMAKDVFTLKEAGEYFNKKFVCVNTDMEKGDGRAIAKQYGVNAYPTFLMINQDGKLLHKIEGAMPLKKLIENVERGLNANRLAEYEASFLSGKLDKTELMSYWKLLSISGETVKAQRVGDNLWGKLSREDKLNLLYWPLLRLRAISIENEEMKFVCANREYFEKKIGKEEIDNLIYNSVMTDLKLVVMSQGPDEKYDKVQVIQDLLEKNDVPHKGALLKIAKLAEAREKQDMNGFMDILDANLNVLDDLEKNIVFEGALQFISLSKDKAQLRRLGEIALRTEESVQDKVVRRNIAKIGFAFRRIGNEGVYWENDKTWEEVIAQAALEKRYIFLNVYNDAQSAELAELFARKEVADYLNKSFINYKINTKEKDYPKIVRRYNTTAPNVLLVLDYEGNLRHQIPNALKGDFIEQMNEAFDDTKASGVLEAMYNRGNRSLEIMTKYLKSLRNLGSPKASIISVELFALLNNEQKTSPEYWMVYNPLYSLISSDMKNFLFSHIQEFREKIGVDKVNKIVVNQIYFDLSGVLYDSKLRYSIDYIDKLVQLIKQYDIPNAQQLLCHARIAKLFKSNIRNVKDYKKASKGLKLEDVPFPVLYANICSAEPERKDEWIAWGKEIMESLKDPKYIQWYKQYLQL